MTTEAQATTIRRDIVVDAPAERAFRLFTERFDQIKPREHNMFGRDIAQRRPQLSHPVAGQRVEDPRAVPTRG